jgi:bifunctional non-homologous end joining protein LigD
LASRIKYDGYRLRLERDGDRVRLFTRNGYDWSRRCPWIVESALTNRQKHFVIDGEAVILGIDGRSDFDALHRITRKSSFTPSTCWLATATTCGALDAQGQSGAAPGPSHRRHLHRPIRQGEIGPDLFRAACKMGLEGLVSKRRDRPYQAGPSKHWLKVKNRQHHAFERVRESFV